jgi:A/G-specific adenine glycosylase
VCLARGPNCLLCPVQVHCAARAAGEPERYPVKTRKLRRGQREHVWLWLQWQDRLWLAQRGQSGVWAGLWSLPEFDSHEDFEQACAAWPGAGESLPSFTHVLTHLDWTLHPLRWTLPPRTAARAREQLTSALPAGRWVTRDEALALGLPAPLRKLLLSS